MVRKLAGPEKPWSQGAPRVALTTLDATPLQTATLAETGAPVASDCAHRHGIETPTNAATAKTQRSGQMFAQARMQLGSVPRPALVLSWPIVLLARRQVEHREIRAVQRPGQMELVLASHCRMEFASMVVSYQMCCPTWHLWQQLSQPSHAQ